MTSRLGRCCNSWRMHVRALQFEEAFPEKGAPLCVGCQSGKRSQVASQILADAGYSNVTNVEGGFMGAQTRSTWWCRQRPRLACACICGCG